MGTERTGIDRRLFVGVLAGGSAVAAAGALLWGRLRSFGDPAAFETQTPASGAPATSHGPPSPPGPPPEPEPAAPGPNATLRGRYPEISEDLPRYFHYLTIPAATLDGYLGDLARHDRQARVEEAREAFLKSTDFFPQGADESKPLTYLTLYDPYRSPCFNPFLAA